MADPAIPGPELPEFIQPMLAKIGDPFDADDHLFEIKWDGTRGMARITADGHDIRNRHGKSTAHLFPELEQLVQLPDGTILDGEIVVMRDGVPDFPALLSRVQASDPHRIELLTRTLPCTYVAFDVLWLAGEDLTGRPLHERRASLPELVAHCPGETVVASEGLSGQGRLFFESVCEQGLEGIVAKRLESRYQPGRRTGSWLKIKRSQEIVCAILGFVSADDGDVRSLIIAAPDSEGTLRPLGKVGSGLDQDTRERLRTAFEARETPAPLIPLKETGRWVEPGLYCRVTYLERTRHGELRAPVFKGLIEEDG